MPNDGRPSLMRLMSSPRLRRGIAWIGAGLIAFAIIGFLALPPIVRPALERTLSTALERKVTIERLKINPFTLSVTLVDVVVAERGEGPPAFTLAELYASGEAMSLFRWVPVVSELKLTRPALRMVRNPDKTYNFSDLINKALAGPPSRFSISNIEVVDGRVDFDDQPEHQQHQVTELAIGIPFLSSLPTQTEIRVEPTFHALIDGHPVAVTGETRPFKDTHETVLHWDFAGLPLPPYLDYVPVGLVPVKVESGRADAKIDFSFVGRGAQPPQMTFAGNILLADLVLSERSGAPLLRVPSLAIAIDRFDPMGASAELRSVAVDDAEIEIHRGRDGVLNLATLAPAESATPGGGPSFRFQVGRIALSRGKVHLDDAAVTPTYAATLNEVTVEVTNLANTGEQKASVAVSFMTDAGASLTHKGTLGLKPVSADGRLQITGLKLAPLYPYYASALNLAVDDGALDVSTDVRFEGGGAAAKLALTNMDATINNFRMRLPDEKELLWRVPMLAVHGGSVDVLKHAISFDAVEGHGAAARILRSADGRFNFDRLIRTPAGGAGTTASAEAWLVEARKVALEDFSAMFADETVSPTAHIALTRVSVTGENLSNAARTKGRATLHATVNKRGELTLSGPLATAPFAATLNVMAKNIDLVPFQPYLSQAVRVLITGGSASARGALDYAAGGETHAVFKGDIGLADVTALDEANATDLLKWKTLSLAGIEARTNPLSVSVGEIALDSLFARLILNENGEFNLQQLTRARNPAASPPVSADQPKMVELAATPPGGGTTWLKLGKATLVNGSVDFTDHFVRPNYSADLTGLVGSLSSLAFDQPADLELRGSVQGTAPVEIVGRINPLVQDLFLDLKASARDIELSPLSPYSDKYVGYGITEGKLSMKVHYLIDKRKLSAENTVVLDQLTFGAKVESPDAIKVPVLLAVALLKDRNGVINFDLPVSGSLDDPQFSVGRIVFRALLNLLVKIVTSPFALLGSLAGHGEELAYIEFAPGSAGLDAASRGKIDVIAKALIDRPALKLDVTGRADPAIDREGLKETALGHKIRLQKFTDLTEAGEPPASVDAVEVAPAEYEPLLVRVYRAEGFPRPRNAIGILKDLPRAEMESLILSHTAVSDDDLHLLAEHRARTVRDRLVGSAKVPAERVFLVAPRVDAEGIKDKGKSTRVDFALH